MLLYLSLKLEKVDLLYIEFSLLNPLVHSVFYKGRLFNFNFGRDPQKNFLWASRLWVGRRKYLILSYVTKKKNEKKTSFSNGLKKIEIYKFVYSIIVNSVHYKGHLTKILILEGILKKISYERRDYESVDENILS